MKGGFLSHHTLMPVKRASLFAPIFFFVVGTIFAIVSVRYLPSVRSHGWMNVVQTGSVGLLMLFLGVLTLWERSRNW